MEFSLYLLAGLALSVLAWHERRASKTLLPSYWAILLSWSLHLTAPFTFTPIHWSKILDITFSWQLDGLARLFAILISGIGLFIFIYAIIYSQGKAAQQRKLLALLQIFAISMLGIVLTDNLIVLFLAWELTTVTSYLLIQFNPADKKANQAAFNGMFISVLGALAMLTGFILLQQQTHSWSIQVALHLAKNNTWLPTIFWLLLLGAVTKSAQFPFHFWLPGAMKAPTPVSAYLHSATMVNAGIYLLARLHPLLSSVNSWYPTLTAFGLSTMLIASILSLFQKDLKAILAYTTLFALGSMIYLLASDQWASAEAFALFLFFHSLYKATAFMWVGTLDKTYGSRNISELQGIGRHWPSASLIAIISLSAMAGLPMFYGFTVKEILFDAKLNSPSLSYGLMALGLFSSMLIAAASLKCLYYWFIGQPSTNKKQTLRYGLLCPMALALVILALELLSPYFAPWLSHAADSITWKTQPFVTINTASSTLLSLLTVAGGILFLAFDRRFNRHDQSWPLALNPRHLFEQSLNQLLLAGRWFTYFTQRQKISRQLMIILAALTLWLALAFFSSGLKIHPALGHHISWPLSILSALLILTGISLLLSRRFLINMISFAVLGLVMSALFVLQGAPDVAMTQLLVEILTVIILVIALRKAKIVPQKTPVTQKISHAIVAILMGSAITALLTNVQGTVLDSKLSQYFIDNSLTLAHGRNVVNVILVDFRALDTLGEALVILAVALATWLLISKRPSRQRQPGAR